MKITRCLALVALALSLSPLHAQVVDDFSQDGWKLFHSTPGQITAKAGSLRLEDAEGEPNWVTASRVFRVDVDKTPVFLVEVAAVSDGGTVKLIRQGPEDKRVAIEIDRAGLYAVNMRDKFGWTGTVDIETCLYAIGGGESITYKYVKFVEKLTEQEQTLMKEREAGGNIKLNVPPFCAVPLFSTCSVYFTSPKVDALQMRYRKQGGDWQRAFAPAYFAEDSMYRGSLVNLEEATSYELELADGDGKVLARTEFHTWRSDVPIAKTVVLDEKNFDGHLAITDSGSPDGWIRYTARDGFVLRNDRQGPLIELRKAKYVILEGLVLRGGLKDAVVVEKCEHVRIINCDIAGWGRVGKQRFDLDGKFYAETGEYINWDTGIRISRSLGTVVERCYIHDPVSTANSWLHSHPAGPQAVGVDKPQSTVLRYNDFVGSDLHRWNDAIEGAGNYDLDGGFNRDADIYGSFHCFANDDTIEIDGGQTNVRVFRNKFEGALCGVSIQGCMSSPSYVFQNLLVNMGDECGVGGQTIKTSSYANGPSAVSFIFNNTCYGDSGDLTIPPNLRIVAKNNIFAGKAAVRGREKSHNSECDYNLLSTADSVPEVHGIVAGPEFLDTGAGLFGLKSSSKAIGNGTRIDGFTPTTGPTDIGAIPTGSDVVLPERPIPVYLDRYQLDFSAKEVKAVSAKSVVATVTGEGFSSPYRIAQNEAFDWFTVTPAQGVLQSGHTVPFTVSIVPERMKTRKVYRGVFLVRLANGYSRPVSVYATTDFVPPTKPADGGSFVSYLEAEAPSGGRAYEVVSDASASGAKCVIVSGRSDSTPAEYRFSVPADGSYIVLMRVKSEEPVGSHDALQFSIDEQPLAEATLRSDTAWAWSMVSHNRQQRLTCLQPFKLKAGEHVLKLSPREPLYLDLIAVTTNPEPFL
ncbi:MAG: right-handed parallel beta-helix repeat-containing protein [Armatimonadota bacterium]